MLQMKVCGILISLRQNKQLGLIVKSSQKGQTDRRAWSARLQIAVVSHVRHRSIFPAKTVGKNYCRMPREIGGHELRSSRGSDNDINLVEELRPGFNRHHASAVSLDVLDCWNKAGSAEGVRPVVFALLGEQFVASAAGQIVKSGGGLGEQDCAHGSVGKIG